ncbi:hypothetical protein M422DRAFT_259934 [Sphaerobolus stellatus SS14]|uniref:Late embryogenesis abundant protein LEA-2 subgroup domain-containing protein n=1 Tax=Sphaerobolus stellatus (strain SS14) TaxID=990650 RepID=A0A0C9VJK7_SPHS4|nr:hypothetical protein M422DRAFT_259934 [Sphaerobolus stellatus SS14]
MLFQAWFALFLSTFFTGAWSSPAPVVERGLQLGDLIKLNLVTKINAILTLDSLTNNLISVNFDIHNPLLLPLAIQKISTQASLNGTVYATFTHTFSPLYVINPGKTVNSGNISNVLLVQGAFNSLDIIPAGILDIKNDVVLIEIVPIPINGLKQASVPTAYSLNLA